MEFINDKNDLLEIAKNTGQEDDWNAARISRNLVAGMIKNAKRDFLTNETENDHEPNKFWSKLHCMFPDKPSSGRISLSDPMQQNVLEDTEIPDYINTFCTNVGSNIVSETDFRYENGTFEDTVFPQTFKLKEVTIEEVLIEIKKLKMSKPSGIENLSTKVLKDALGILAHQFTWLINLSVSTSNVPNDWKKAKITPIPKDGGLSNVNNYRPIAILPVTSKILEHLIHTQTKKYVDNNNFLDVNQGGFRKNNSTTAATASVLDGIYTNINQQQITYAIFIDFKKAFDSINHKILLNKLAKLGFHDQTIKWFESYLTNRTQYTVVNEMKSSLLDITCGVPQGSVLGPMLFLIFINDIKTAIKYSGYKLYADDTVLYSNDTGQTSAELHNCIQQDLNNVQSWCIRNAIMMNVKKTKSMVFGTRQKVAEDNNVHFFVNNRPLEIVPLYKYLGTYVDSELNFVRQSNETIKSISYKLYFLDKIKIYLNTESLLRLYKAYIQPYFDYNDIFLENTTAKQYDKLTRLQKRCLRRCLPDNQKIDRDEIYNITGINKLQDRANAHLLKLMYKSAQAMPYLEERERRTRLHDGPVLYTPFPNNETFRKSPIFKGDHPLE